MLCVLHHATVNFSLPEKREPFLKEIIYPQKGNPLNLKMSMFSLATHTLSSCLFLHFINWNTHSDLLRTHSFFMIASRCSYSYLLISSIPDSRHCITIKYLSFAKQMIIIHSHLQTQADACSHNDTTVFFSLV